MVDDVMTTHVGVGGTDRHRRRASTMEGEDVTLGSISRLCATVVDDEGRENRKDDTETETRREAGV